MLWSPEHPTLIDATVTLYDGDSVVDQAVSYFGMRKVGTERGRFTLNGFSYYLRMVLEQGYYPESHLAAPSEQAIHDEVEWIKKLGFNAVRIHQKVEDPRFLYWCDKLGVIVWGEMANAYGFSPQAAERFTCEWLEVIHRDYNHPCIVAWTPINESWGTPNLPSDPMQRDYIRALYHLTHTMDSTRLVLGNEGWEQPISDIIGIHDYNLNGSVLVERYKTAEDVEQTLKERRPGNHLLLLDGFPRNEQPVMITEFGGMSFEPKPGETWYAYGTVKTSEEYIAKYAEIVHALYESSVVCGFCFTQLTDTEQEINGMLDAQRQPKADPEALAAINLSKAKR
jgi:hypothetical protein